MKKYFKRYFFNNTSLFLAKELYNSSQNVNDEVVKDINYSLIELKNINTKKNPKNENPHKIVNVVQKILNFNKQQQVKGLPSDLARIARVAKFSDYKISDHSSLKMLTLKKMLQRLPIALAQVKAGNTSEILLNQIRIIIYSLYQAKVITKKVYSNIMNSIKL